MPISYGSALPPPDAQGPTKGEIRIRVDKLLLDDAAINHSPGDVTPSGLERADGTGAASSPSGAGNKRSPNKFFIPIDHCAVAPLFLGERWPSGEVVPSTPAEHRAPCTIVYAIKADPKAFQEYLRAMSSSPHRGLLLEVFVPSSYSGRNPIPVGRAIVDLQAIGPRHSIAGWFSVGASRLLGQPSEEGPPSPVNRVLGRVKVCITLTFFSRPPREVRSTLPSAISRQSKFVKPPSLAALASTVQFDPEAYRETTSVESPALPSSSPLQLATHRNIAPHDKKESTPTPKRSRIPQSATEPQNRLETQPTQKGSPSATLHAPLPRSPSQEKLEAAVRALVNGDDQSEKQVCREERKEEAPSCDATLEDILQRGRALKENMARALKESSSPLSTGSRLLPSPDEPPELHDDSLEIEQVISTIRDDPIYRASDSDEEALYTSHESDVALDVGEACLQRVLTQDGKGADAVGTKIAVAPTSSAIPAAVIQSEAVSWLTDKKRMPKPSNGYQRPPGGSMTLHGNVVVEIEFSEISFAHTPTTADLEEFRIHVALSRDITTPHGACGQYSSLIHSTPLTEKQIRLHFAVSTFDEVKSKLVVEFFKVKSRPILPPGTTLLPPNRETRREVVAEEPLGLCITGFFDQQRSISLRDPIQDEVNAFAQLSIHLRPPNDKRSAPVHSKKAAPPTRASQAPSEHTSILTSRSPSKEDALREVYPASLSKSGNSSSRKFLTSARRSSSTSTSSSDGAERVYQLPNDHNSDTSTVSSGSTHRTEESEEEIHTAPSHQRIHTTTSSSSGSDPYVASPQSANEWSSPGVRVLRRSEATPEWSADGNVSLSKKAASSDKFSSSPASAFASKASPKQTERGSITVDQPVAATAAPFVALPPPSGRCRCHVAIMDVRQAPHVTIAHRSASDACPVARPAPVPTQSYLDAGLRAVVPPGSSAAMVDSRHHSFRPPNLFFVIEEIYSGADGSSASTGAIPHWTVEDYRGGYFDRTDVVYSSCNPSFSYEAILSLPQESVLLTQMQTKSKQSPSGKAREGTLSGKGSALHKPGTALRPEVEEATVVSPCLRELQLTMWHLLDAEDPQFQPIQEGQSQEEHFWSNAAYFGECRIDLRPLKHLPSLQGYYRITATGSEPLMEPTKLPTCSSVCMGYIHIGITLIPLLESSNQKWVSDPSVVGHTPPTLAEKID